MESGFDKILEAQLVVVTPQLYGLTQHPWQVQPAVLALQLIHQLADVGLMRRQDLGRQFQYGGESGTTPFELPLKYLFRLFLACQI